MKKILLTVGMLTLAACTAAHDSAVRGLDEVQQDTNNGIDKTRELLNIGHTPQPTVTPQERYCYQVYEDIICYPTPQTGKGLAMTGYQTTSGKSGYLLQNTTLKNTTAPDSQYVAESTTNKAPGALKKPNAPQGMHEIIFDADELNPKDLVSTKQQ